MFASKKEQTKFFMQHCIVDYGHLKLRQFEFLGLFVSKKSISGRKVTLSSESTLASVHTIEALLATTFVSDQL